MTFTVFPGTFYNFTIAGCTRVGCGAEESIFTKSLDMGKCGFCIFFLFFSRKFKNLRLLFVISICLAISQSPKGYKVELSFLVIPKLVTSYGIILIMVLNVVPELLIQNDLFLVPIKPLPAACDFAIHEHKILETTTPQVKVLMTFLKHFNLNFDKTKYLRDLTVI